MARIPRRVALALALLVGAVGPSAGTGDDTFWWSAATSDDAWDAVEIVDGAETTNWILAPGHVTDLLPFDEPTYITTSEHHDLQDLPPAVVESDASSGPLYVGGWNPSLDGEHGDPRGHGGELHVVAGVLHTSDGYIRVGTRGAEGTIRQSGGRVENDQAISLGWISPESLGRYELSGGEVAARLNVGVTGTGFLDMTGGVVDPEGHYGTRVPAFRPMTGDRLPHPSLGVVNQRGGTFSPVALWLGESAGNVGVLVVRQGVDPEGPSVVDVDSAEVGLEGTGVLVQTGGLVEVNRSLVLGGGYGGVGQCTISGGRLVQNRRTVPATQPLESGLHVGIEGMGRLMVVGAEPEIEIAGVYRQNGRSLLTFVIGKDGVAPIQVGRDARFEAGAAVRVQLADDYTPAVGEAFDLVVAADGIRDLGLRVDGPEVGDFDLDTAQPGRLRAVYVADRDADGVPHPADNCSEVPNAGQTDSDADGYGNACDADYDEDGRVGLPDLEAVQNAFGRTVSGAEAELDADGDGRVGLVELWLVQQQMQRGVPGPSGLACAGSFPCP